MENYKVEVVKSEKHADNTGRTVVRVSAKNEKDMLTLPDVKEIVKELNQKTTKDYVIRGLTGTKFQVLKKQKNSNLVDDTLIEEYFNNAVINPNKFKAFYQLQIYLYDN